MSDIRELAERLAVECGISEFGGCTEANIERLVRAAMREAYARALAIAGDSDYEAPARGYYDQLGDSAKTRWNIEAAIRAEADKLAAGTKSAWVCNECGSHEFTGAVSEDDLEWLACSGCGGDEFHKAPAEAAKLEGK